MPEDNLSKFHALSERLAKNEISTTKDIQRIEEHISSIDKDLWEIKQNLKNISQNSQDIAVLDAQIKGIEKLFDAQKEALKQKEDKWYKNISIWISMLALLGSCFLGYLNYAKPTNQQYQRIGDNNVSSSNKK